MARISSHVQKLWCGCNWERERERERLTSSKTKIGPWDNWFTTKMGYLLRETKKERKIYWRLRRPRLVHETIGSQQKWGIYSERQRSRESEREGQRQAGKLGRQGRNGQDLGWVKGPKCPCVHVLLFFFEGWWGQWNGQEVVKRLFTQLTHFDGAPSVKCPSPAPVSQFGRRLSLTFSLFLSLSLSLIFIHS